MIRFVVVAAALVCMTGISSGAEVPADTATRIKSVAERAGKAGAGKPGEFAKEYVEAANGAILAAQNAFTSGNDRKALQKLELAEMQLTVAEAKTAEKETAEETALRRAELKDLEGRLERYIQGEEE